MAQVVKITDNTEIPVGNLEGIPKIIDSICNKTLSSLGAEGVFIFPNAIKESEDIENNEYILKKRGAEYKTGNVMGFLGCGDERLIIQSRFKESDNDYFLQYILGKVLELPNVIKHNTDASLDEKLFDYLVFLFPEYLRTALQKGLFKVYIKEKYNDEKMRGSLDVARHIKSNTPFTGKVAYNRSEFTYDNNLTELIRHTIEYINTKRYGRSILNLVRDETKAIIEKTQKYRLADRRKIIEWNRRNPVRHAYYREYRRLQLLCLMILQHARHSLGNGEKKIYGILFDGSWIWEEYVNKLIGEYFYHPRNKGKGEGRHTQWLFFDGIKQPQGRIYPDFISKDSKNRIIIDAKYRPKDNIRGNDYRQILSYMFRFDSKKGYFIYPKESSDADVILYLNEGTTFEKNVKPRDDIIYVKKYGFIVPQGRTSFKEFSKTMERKESEFVKEFISNELKELHDCEVGIKEE